MHFRVEVRWLLLDLAAQKRKAEKEANEAARVQRTMHDIESKAFASYAADLEEREELKAAKAPVKKPVNSEALHKVKWKLNRHDLSFVGIGKEEHHVRCSEASASGHWRLFDAEEWENWWTAEKDCQRETSVP